MKEFKRKVISVLVAIVLIIIIGIVAFGSKIKASLDNGEEINARFFLALIYPEKYAYSMEQANLSEYFEIFSDSDISIVLQDERIADKGLMVNGVPYFAYDTIRNLFTDRFYLNKEEQVLLYTTSTDVIKVSYGEDKTGYYVSSAFNPTEYPIVVEKGDVIYVAADYIRKYANFSYEVYSQPNRMQLYTKWEPRRDAVVLRDTYLRIRGGIKSEVLCSLDKDSHVTVLEVMENWTKIKTSDCFIGYVENSAISDFEEITDTPVTDAYNPQEDFANATASANKIALVWHQIGAPDNGDALQEALTGTQGLNVVSPTWFFLAAENNGFVSYANSWYVTTAHKHGLKVWALVSDLEIDVDEYELFKSSSNRKELIDKLITATTGAGADGINIDLERIGKDTGPHFVQFLRELSIETRKNGLVLSVDNYPQNQGNLYYNLKEQGLIADYVILMNYGEHWAGSEVGSLASIGYVEQSISTAIDAGVPANKVINGVPFYTRLWRTDSSNSTSSTAIGMPESFNWAANRNITPVWDDTTCQYYVDYNSDGARFQMWMEDAESLETRIAIMNNYGVGGIAAWKLGLESSEVWPVVAAYMSN